MTHAQIDAYLTTVDRRLEAAVAAKVPGAFLVGYRTDATGANIPQFFVHGGPAGRAALRTLGVEVAPLGLAMARTTLIAQHRA
jgi:hypothetical protein